MGQKIDLPDEVIQLFSIVSRRLDQTASDHGLRLTDMLVLWYITREGKETGDAENPVAVLRSQLMHRLRLELQYGESLLSSSLTRLEKSGFLTRAMLVDRARRRELFGEEKTAGSSLTIIMTKTGLEKIGKLEAGVKDELEQTVRGTFAAIIPFWGAVKRASKALLHAYLARREQQLEKRVGG